MNLKKGQNVKIHLTEEAGQVRGCVKECDSAGISLIDATVYWHQADKEDLPDPTFLPWSSVLLVMGDR